MNQLNLNQYMKDVNNQQIFKSNSTNGPKINNNNNNKIAIPQIQYPGLFSGRNINKTELYSKFYSSIVKGNSSLLTKNNEQLKSNFSFNNKKNNQINLPQSLHNEHNPIIKEKGHSKALSNPFNIDFKIKSSSQIQFSKINQKSHIQRYRKINRIRNYVK